MKLTLSSSALTSLLESVKPALSTRTTIPVLQSVRLVATKESLLATVTNLDLWIESSESATVETPGEICVNFSRLLDAAKVMPDGEVNLSATANALSITAGRATIKLPGFASTEFPPFPAEGLSAAISFTAHRHFHRMANFASVDPGRYVLNGIYLGKNAAVAVDGKKLMALETDFDLNVIVPTATAQAVGALEAEAITLRHGVGLVQFSDGSTTLTSKTIEGSFPAWKSVIPDDCDTQITLNRQELLDAARVACVAMNEAKYDSVRLDFTKVACRVTLASKEIGEGAQTVDCDAQKDFTIAFAPHFLLPVLRAVQSETITLRLKDEMSPLVVKQDGLTLVAMPNRVG